MRWVVRIVFGLIVIAVLAVAALFLMPSDQIARLLTRQVEAATGAKLTVAGAIRPTLWPEPGVTLNGVTLAAPGMPPVLEAESLTVGVDAEALWGGAVRVRKVAFDAPLIRLVRDAEGQVNWDFAASRAAAAPEAAEGTTAAAGDSPEAAATPSLGSLTLDEGTIRNGRVTFADEGTGQAWRADDLDLTLRLPAGGAGDVSAGFTVDGAPVAVSMTVEELGKALEGAVVPVDFSAEYDGSRAAFKGRAGFAPVAAEGALDAALLSPGALARRFGAPVADLPVGMGRDRLEVAGQMTWTPARSLHLRDGRIAADGNVVTGDFDLETTGARPKIAARFRTDTLTFGAAPGTSAAGGKAAQAAAPAKGGGWPKDRIDASALGLIDGTIRIDAGQVSFAGQSFAPVRGTLSIENARAVAEIAELGVVGGTVAGRFVANNRKGLSVGGDLSAKGADIGALARLAGYDRIEGRGNAALKFLGVGNSVDAIMKSFEGNGTLALSGGQVRGIDLQRALRDLDPAAISDTAVTPIDALQASYAIAGGVLTNRDLVVQSPAVTVTGRGILDLGQRRIDYRFVPAGNAAGNDLRVPLLVTGPWESPSFRLDFETIAEERLDQEKEKLKAKAEEKLLEELDVAPVEGESTEDALRRKLEEEALKGLGKLLGGD